MASITGQVVDDATIYREKPLAIMAYSVAIPFSLVELALSGSLRVLSYPLPLEKDQDKAISSWLSNSSRSVAVSVFNTVASLLGIDPAFNDISRKLSLPQKLNSQREFDNCIDLIEKTPTFGPFLKDVSIGSMIYADIAELVRLCPKIEVLDLSEYKVAKDSDLKHIAKLTSLHTLNLSNCTDITLKGFIFLKPSSVKTLTLTNLPQLSTEIIEIIKTLSYLDSLTTEDSSQVTEKEQTSGKDSPVVSLKQKCLDPTYVKPADGYQGQLL